MAKRDKITEIGIVLYDGEKIIDQYQTLVNPGRSIPREITRITGITNEMVSDAPQFYEVAKNVVKMTEGAIFVAHNVRFDYSFLKEEFGSLGYTFTKRQLCTVRLSRKTFPGLRSYSLGNLIKHFDITVNARHRALDDAIATTELLEKILNQDYADQTIDQIINAGIKTSKLPKEITLDKLHSLPEGPGVYYFHNVYNKIIYVGKSINIKKRVMQHFSKTTQKAERLARMVSDVTFEETGDELIAMLLESHEIKALKPEVNKAQRTSEYPYFIHHYFDSNGYLCFKWEKSSIKTRKNKNILSHYGSKQGAISHLAGITKELGLCQSKTDLYERDGPCFLYKTKVCYGACIEEENIEDYNSRAEIGIDFLKRIFDKNFFIVTQGRSVDEKGIILVEEGHYKGYGYIGIEDLNYGIEEIKEAVRYVPINPETNGIIRTFLSKHPLIKTISF
ncbi:MAG: DNA polymerase-3 subunit epsilon [Saprospiraceae bacterium]|jgi:DNA polymerase-3 subunit epsilon